MGPKRKVKSQSSCCASLARLAAAKRVSAASIGAPVWEQGRDGVERRLEAPEGVQPKRMDGKTGD